MKRFMARRRFSVFALTAATVCIVLLSYHHAKLVPEFSQVKKAFIGAVETRLSIGSFVSADGSPTSLSDTERRQSIDAFAASASRYYAADNPTREKYLRLHQAYLQDNGDNLFYSVGNGVLDCDFDRIRFHDGGKSATVKARYTSWAKFVERKETGAFEVSAPVNRNYETALMVKEDGNWKLLQTLDGVKEFGDDAAKQPDRADTVEARALQANIGNAKKICHAAYPSFASALDAANSIDASAINPF